jgi:oxazoline/thiazoline synthase
LLQRPQLKKCYRVEYLAPDHVFLLGERDQQAFTGQVPWVIVPLLTGEYTSVELINRLETRLSFPDVLHFLSELEAHGYTIEAGDPSIPVEIAAFWHEFGIDTGTATDRLAKTRVRLRAIGRCQIDQLKTALARLNVRLDNIGDIEVIVTDDYLRPELEAVDQEAIAATRPWMPAKLVGTDIWIGPIFRPRTNACWKCLFEAVSGNRQLENFVSGKARVTAHLSEPRALSPVTFDLAADFAALEIVKWIVGGSHPQLETGLLSFDTIRMTLSTHPVTRRPQCPVCGQPELLRQPRSLVLSNRRKTTASNGERFVIAPDDALARYSRHLSPITGVVTWLIETTRESDGLWYTYSAGHRFPILRDEVPWLIRSIRSNTGGKGLSRLQAQLSAIGEAFERYSVAFYGDEPRLRKCYRALADDALHPYACLNFSDKQYAERDAWNARLIGSRLHVVPNTFDVTRDVDWSPVWSLTEERFKYVPSAFCYIGHPESRSLFFCAGDSNGCAAGNSIEEAITHGFLELVERDAVALWWYNSIRRPRIDLESFQMPYLNALSSSYRKINREFWVLDITTDFDIPTMVAVSRRTDGKSEDIILGCAAHLNPKTALLRAILELNQFLPAVTRKNERGEVIYEFPDDEAIQWWKTARSDSQLFLRPNSDAASRRLEDYSNRETDDALRDVITCLDITRQLGFEMLVLDHTRPEIGTPVCRVIVPGLRHFWRRLGPGRLYDTPVKLGWIVKARAEEEMNPFSIFF